MLVAVVNDPSLKTILGEGSPAITWKLVRIVSGEIKKPVPSEYPPITLTTEFFNSLRST